MKKLGTVNFYVPVLLSVPRPYTVLAEDITVFAESHVWDAQGQLTTLQRVDITAGTDQADLQAIAGWINRIKDRMEAE